MCLSSKDTSSGKVAVPLNAAPSSLKAQILLHLCWSLAVPPVPSWCSKHSVPQGHFRNWRNLVLEEKKKKEVKDLSVGTLMTLPALLRPGRCAMRMKVTSCSDTLQCLFPG